MLKLLYNLFLVSQSRKKILSSCSSIFKYWKIKKPSIFCQRWLVYWKKNISDSILRVTLFSSVQVQFSFFFKHKIIIILITINMYIINNIMGDKNDEMHYENWRHRFFVTAFISFHHERFSVKIIYIKTDICICNDKLSLIICRITF